MVESHKKIPKRETESGYKKNSSFLIYKEELYKSSEP